VRWQTGTAAWRRRQARSGHGAGSGQRRGRGPRSVSTPVDVRGHSLRSGRRRSATADSFKTSIRKSGLTGLNCAASQSRRMEEIGGPDSTNVPTDVTRTSSGTQTDDGTARLARGTWRRTRCLSEVNDVNKHSALLQFRGHQSGRGDTAEELDLSAPEPDPAQVGWQRYCRR
jgi:hypothetical protein